MESGERSDFHNLQPNSMAFASTPQCRPRERLPGDFNDYEYDGFGELLRTSLANMTSFMSDSSSLLLTTTTDSALQADVVEA